MGVPICSERPFLLNSFRAFPRLPRASSALLHAFSKVDPNLTYARSALFPQSTRVWSTLSPCFPAVWLHLEYVRPAFFRGLAASGIRPLRVLSRSTCIWDMPGPRFPYDHSRSGPCQLLVRPDTTPEIMNQEGISIYDTIECSVCFSLSRKPVRLFSFC